MDQKIFEALQADYAEVETAFAGCLELYIKYLKKFPADETYSELLEAVSGQKLPDIECTVHGFKGLCATLRLTTLWEMAKEIEALAKQGKIEEVQNRMPELMKEYNRVILCIEQYI